MHIYKYEILNVKICQTNLHNMVLCFIKINEIKINPCYLQVDRDHHQVDTHHYLYAEDQISEQEK